MSETEISAESAGNGTQEGAGDATVLPSRSALGRLCAIVLSMETVVFWLAIPVALAINHASPRPAVTAGVALALAAVVLAVLARRRLRWTLVGGSVLQVIVIAVGVIVPVMYFLGAIFAALWVIGIMLGRRLDVPAQPY
jgi:hypothetical protein